MYQVGELVVYGAEGVCRVAAIGPLEMRGAQKGTDYYTLTPLYGTGKIFIPVDTNVSIRPVMTRAEAEALIDRIPEIPEEVYENNNPRLLNEHYQALLKSYDCVDLVRMIRAIYAKGQRGRRLGQVDERTFKKTEEMLHEELAAALDIPPDQVKDYICRRVEALEKT